MLFSPLVVEMPLSGAPRYLTNETRRIFWQTVVQGGC